MLPAARDRGFFPDTALSQQLIPLFETLGVAGVCRLARCNKAWKNTLDAWRATQATVVDIRKFTEVLRNFQCKFATAPHFGPGVVSFEVGCRPTAFVVEKYPQLQTLKARNLSDNDLRRLMRCTALRNLDLEGPVTAKRVVALAKAFGQLRSVRLEDALDRVSLIKLVQASPNLEVLSCSVLYGRLTDADADKLMECKTLRELSLKPAATFSAEVVGPTLSGKAVNALIEKCPNLVYLEVGWIRREHELKRPLPAGLTFVCGERPKMGETITLKVVCEDGDEVFFKIDPDTRLRRLMAAFCQRQGVRREQVRFLFDDKPLRDEETALDLEMVDQDAIYAHLNQM